MMTPKMKEDICIRIRESSRQLFLSARISEVCREKGTQKQLFSYKVNSESSIVFFSTLAYTINETCGFSKIYK